MADTVQVAVSGAAGRMGQRIVALVHADPELTLAAALEPARTYRDEKGDRDHNEGHNQDVDRSPGGAVLTVPEQQPELDQHSQQRRGHKAVRRCEQAALQIFDVIFDQLLELFDLIVYIEADLCKIEENDGHCGKQAQCGP